MPRGVYPRPSVLERFWAKVDRRGLDECWPWLGARTGHFGHGVFESFMTGQKAYGAHRASWELHNGRIPDGLVIMHTCDNPPCVNPRHLRADTQAENQHDKARKGRAARLPGASHPLASVAYEDATVIWRLSAVGIPQAAIARQFGISQTTVNRILNRPSWRVV